MGPFAHDIMESAPGGGARLDLPTTVAASGFAFPSIYSFPPFFSRQLNVVTWTHQRQQWAQLILDYCRYHRIFILELKEETCERDLFRNGALQRRLPLGVLREIMTFMDQAGMACSPDESKDDATARRLVYWRTPAEWASLIYEWITAAGMTNSILTFFDITSGESPGSAEFRDMPEAMLRRALAVLEQRGKAQIFRGTGQDGDGVKFA